MEKRKNSVRLRRIFWLLLYAAGCMVSGRTEGLPAAAVDVRQAPCVALTFDDGPDKTYTPQLLDGLKERGVKASFFVIGKNISGNEALLVRMKEEGHLIGNHTYSHVQLNNISSEKPEKKWKRPATKYLK